jgi:hypothetical protein
MVSTGPERDQTMLLPEFAAEIIRPQIIRPQIIGPQDKAAPHKSAKTK